MWRSGSKHGRRQEFQKLYGDEENQGCHARHNKENVDFHIMEEIAKKLPMSQVDRPAWDFGKLDFAKYR